LFTGAGDHITILSNIPCDKPDMHAGGLPTNAVPWQTTGEPPTGLDGDGLVQVYVIPVPDGQTGNIGLMSAVPIVTKGGAEVHPKNTIFTIRSYREKLRLS